MDAETLEILDRANHIAANTELDDLLDQMMDLILDTCKARAGTLYLVDKLAGELIIRVVRGDPGSERLLGQRMPVDTGIAGATVLSRRPLLIDDVRRDPRWFSGFGEFTGITLLNMISIPLMLRGVPIGVVQVFNHQQAPVELVQVLGNRMASEIEKSVLLEASEGHSRRLEQLVGMMAQIGSSLDRDEILRLIIHSARILLDAEACSLFLLDDESGDLVLTLSSQRDEQYSLENQHIPYGKGIIGNVVETGETVNVANTDQDDRFYRQFDDSSGFVTRSILAVPLKARIIQLGNEQGATPERIIGGLEAINKASGPFTDEDARMLQMLTGQAATVHEIASLYAEANELFLGVIKSLTAAIDAKDPYTVGHSQRVSDFSIEIARQLDLPADVIRKVRTGSLFHDVGKIGIPDNVLGKPGKLTEDEYRQIKQHPAIGARILGQVTQMRGELPAMEEHHERLDGSGYPNGLKEQEISLIGKIVAVADVFDAMTSDRPYRRPMPVDEVLTYLQARVGSEFDGRCVEALCRAVTEGTVRTQLQS